jgi:hypothetical protein
MRSQILAAIGFSVVAAGPLALATACRSAPSSPEAQVRAVVATAERSAEKKDIQTLKRLIADGYRDDEGNRKADLIRLLAYHLLRNESIHLLTRVRTVEFPTAGNAVVSVFVAMAGREIPAADLLAQLHADLYRFDLDLVSAGAGAWLLTHARWRPAEIDDFADAAPAQ